MKVGVTATREGLSDRQKATLRDGLIQCGATELHHGDCVGGDADAHAIAKELGLRVVVHPPVNPKLRAFCDGDEIREPKGYLARDRDIVDETVFLFGMPKGPEVRRSGTWATIRYAKQVNRDRLITYP